MARSALFEATCSGGLILSSNRFALLKNPGVATRLRNFEVSLSGGYRRINGYTRFGGEDATSPWGETPVLGVHPYAAGVVVVSGDGIWYGEDGITWIQVNKDTSPSGVAENILSAEDPIPREGQERAHFELMRGTIDQPTNPYGTLSIATRTGALANFFIEGTGPSRTFSYAETTLTTVMTDAALLAVHAGHLCVVDTLNAPNTVYYSANSSDTDFVGTGSGSVVLPDHIVGIKGFRDSLYIFCKNSIHRLVEINEPTLTQVVPVTTNLGCVDGFTIQEIGGDLVYLAPDGIRTIAGTERIGDVELSSVSRAIQPLIASITDNSSRYTFSSVVLRGKNQYRMYYTDVTGLGRGVIGTLVGSDQGLGYQWSEVVGIPVYCINADFNEDGQDIVYHGGLLGKVHLHDTGSSFNGDPIEAEYQAPDIDFSDLGMRKTLHYIQMSLTNEGAAEVWCQPTFDFFSTRVQQPNAFPLINEISPAIFGSFVFGSAVFGAEANPLVRKPLQGSGHSVAFKFYSLDDNPPYTINGYQLEVIPSGRR